MTVNWLAILGSAVAAWMFGAAWYGALGKLWAQARGLSFDPANRKPPLVPMAISFVAEVLMALVLAGVITHVAKNSPTWQAGASIGALTWAGFVATTIATNNAYGGSRWSLTAIDSGHWLGVLVIQGALLGALL